MFSAFASYSVKTFAEIHREVLLQTPSKKDRLQVVAADIINAGRTHKKVDFSGMAEFEQWAKGEIGNADMNLFADVPDQNAFTQGSAQESRFS